MEVADTEREATSEALFRHLKGRGLRGVGFVTSDDHAGLRAAIARHFQGASWQRCQVHFARHLRGRVGANHRARLGAAEWRSSHPSVATAREEELEDCLACDAVSPAHRLRVRTTNGRERFNQELKRRPRVVRIFPNRAALLRLVTALAMEQSDEGISGRRYLTMEPLGEVSAPAMSVAQAA